MGIEIRLFLVIEPAGIGTQGTPSDRARTRPDGSPHPTHL
jgi:hypothetical protein